MYVHRSNRIEKLVDVLADVVAQPLADPMQPERIAVQGRGMERWLSMQLARRFGVWANPEFPFPRHLVQEQLRAVLGNDALDPAFEPEALRWKVAAQLPALLDRPEFAPLRRYLEADTSSFRLLELAERIANLFDQYVVFRPELILRWERNHDADWQARLWRAISAGRPAAHMAACAHAFAERMQRQAELPAGLPPRICLFGLSTLAPLYLQILELLSRWTEIHLFILSPSREYWGQIQSQRENLRRRRSDAPHEEIERILQQDAGNPLLASLGKLGREFQEVLEATTEYVDADGDLYAEPGSATVLMAIQSDMLALRYRSAGGADPPLPLADESIRVHACHSATREVEVLHEQLRHLFENDKDLHPHDVVVMSPDIDEYAPLIEAVFGGAEDDAPRIPYRIADRRLRATEDVVHAFLDLLAAMGGRMTASEVVDLLELEAVRERLSIAAAQLDDMRAWIKGSGIRWAIDSSHRRHAEQPEIEGNTWRFGLDRLLLGYAMPGGGRRMFAGVLPYDDIEGTSAATLGSLAQFCDVLFGYHRDFERPRSVSAWRESLERMLAELVDDEGPRAYQHQQIRAVLADLAKQADAAGFDSEIELGAMRDRLEAGLEQKAPGRNFLSGGVTFCALVPMRTIPFEVVCLLGMNDDVFPRSRRPLAFDLMARRPRAGDRSSRDDDRYLFLEALLSARRKLILTYVGQSVHDNAERPPSVVVSELLDTIDQSFRAAAPPARKGTAASSSQMDLFAASSDAGGSESDRIVTRHPLQAFSPRYFDPRRVRGLVSYSRRHYEAAGALVAEKDHTLRPFVSEAVPLDDDRPCEVTVDQLVRFFENPARAFLQSRLSLFLGDDLDVIEDREPIELDHLEQWHVGNALLQAALAGERIEDVCAGEIAAGSLPPGTLGACAIEEIRQRAVAIAATTAALRQGEPLPPLEIDTELDEVRLIGVLRDRWPSGFSQFQYSKLPNRRELAVWLRHLIIHLIEGKESARPSFLVGRGKDGPVTIRFKPVANASALLRPLVGLYRLGQTTPLPLFDKASRAYAHCYLQVGRRRPTTNDMHEAALADAVKAYEGSSASSFCDLTNPYIDQAFRDRRPVRDDEEIPGAPEDLPAKFSSLALAVYQPFFEHREEEKS